MPSATEIDVIFQRVLLAQGPTCPVGIATFELGGERVRCAGLTLDACYEAAELLGCGAEGKRERKPSLMSV